MRPTFQRALLLLLASVVVVALVPAGVALERRLESELEAGARADLAVAPMVLADRERARADAMKMHAMDLAAVDGLAAAVEAGDRDGAVLLAAKAALDPTERPVLLPAAGPQWLGPLLDPGAVARVRDGGAAMAYGYGEAGLHALSLVPLEAGDRVLAWVGVVALGGRDLVGTLSALTGSEVTVAAEGRALVSTLDSATARAAAAGSGRPGAADTVRELTLAGSRHWAVAAPLGELGTVVFTRSVDEELSLLPSLRRNALTAGLLALALAMLVGALVSTALARRVRGLATAADRLAEGDYTAPLSPSRVREIDRLSRAFGSMRDRLAARLEELAGANRELAARQERLSALQAEMIQQDRLVASGRLVSELAHEIRNPIANIRNCLEIVRRRDDDDPVARRFADLAIDELLRMHELAERMLDLNRPIDPAADRCDAGDVVGQVVALYRAGTGRGITIEVRGRPPGPAAISPDALKQVLINLLENAREASPREGTIRVRMSAADPGDVADPGDRAADPATDRAVGPADGGDAGAGDAGTRTALAIEVLDEGPGIPPDILPRVFDPFFTTKGEARGVGLGLFVAEGLVRRAGGRLTAANRAGGGARFRVELNSPAGPGQRAERVPGGGRAEDPASREEHHA